MCGRVNVSDNEGLRLLLESMGMTTWPTREPRFNVAPTQTLDVVGWVDDDLALMPMSWGVSLSVPGKKGMVTKRVQNARDDKVWSSRLWKPMVAAQRVLVPVNGFYEWRRENRKLVAAYHIAPSAADAMFFAGIYRRASDDSTQPELAVLTTSANDAMRSIHDRMPIILSAGNEAMAWLRESDKDSLQALMQPASNDALRFVEVDDYVNKSTHEGPQCIEPRIQLL